MRSKKRLAFVYGRAGLNAAKLLYMPFGINVVKLLAEGNTIIDLYLTQDASEDYKTYLPKNVNIIFLNHPKVWQYGSGKGLYVLLNLYFYLKTFGKKYDSVWGIGQVGTVLGGKLAFKKNKPFYYLSDEFPNISYLTIWRDAEKKYALTSKFWVVPDETRLKVTQQQITGLDKIQGYTLPNIPLKDSENNYAEVNWHEKLGLALSQKIVMYAGGIDKENNIEQLLTVFPFTNEKFILVMVGNGKQYKKNMLYKHPRIIWIENALTDEELHSLIRYSVCNICYYSDIMDLEYVGKSSGKIMRSLLMRTPVITTNFKSLQFITDDGMGELITQPFELIEALNKIENYRANYVAQIEENISKYYFESYWKNLLVNPKDFE
jgi:hypothetical protein